MFGSGNKVMTKRMDDKGKVLSGPAPMAAEKMTDEKGMPDHRHVAAGDMIAAFHEKSPTKLTEALSNWMDLHRARK